MTLPESATNTLPPNTSRHTSRPQGQTRSRVMLLALFAIFFAPVAISLLLQTPMFHYNAPATKNFGTLISPVQPVDLGTARQPGIQNNAQAVWTVLLIPDAKSDLATQVALIESIRQAQGRHIDRVRLELIEVDSAPRNVGADWRVRTISAEQLLNLRSQLGLNDAGGVVILDPFRNAMLRHPAGFNGSHLRKDLARILRISQAGKKQSEGLIG